MRKGSIALIMLFTPFSVLLSQVYIEVKPLKEHISVTQSPLRVNVVNYEMIGIEIVGHYENTSADADYSGNLKIHMDKKLPDYISGWANKTTVLSPETKQTVSNIIYIHPTQTVRDTITFYIGLWRGNPPNQHLAADIYSIVISSVESQMKPARILPEPTFSSGLRNTIQWSPARENDIDTQEAYVFDIRDLTNLQNSLRRLYKTSAGDTRSSDFENLKNGHTYGYFIRTDYEKPDRLYSLYSKIVYSRQDHTPPEMVLRPLALGLDGRVEITWQPVSDSLSGVARYDIYRAFDTQEEALVHSISVSDPQPGVYRWVDATIQKGWPYYFRVRAVDGVGNAGEGEISDVVTIEGADVPPIINESPMRPVPVLQDGDGHDIPYIQGARDTVTFARIDSRVKRIRFEAVRDQLDYLNQTPVIGGRYFDSGWIQRPFPPHWVFDYGYHGNVQVDSAGQVHYDTGTPLDLNFVDRHTYYRRMTLDFGTTMRYDTVSVVPDCFFPSDIRNLDAKATIADPNPVSPDSGYTAWQIRLAWEPAQDGTSGLKRYRIFRKIEGQDADFNEIPLSEYQFLSTSFVDLIPDSVLVARNATIHYRVVSEDRIGNRRLLAETSWETSDQALGGPVLIMTGMDATWIKVVKAPIKHPLQFSYPAGNEQYQSLAIGEDSLFTRMSRVAYQIDHFDRTPVHEYLISVNGVEETHPNAGQDTLQIVLPDEEFIHIKARAIYQGGRSSVWSKPQTVIRTRPIPPVNLRVENDPDSWEGNIYLGWEKPSTDVVYYEIWRWDSAGDSALVGIDSSRTPRVSWTDLYSTDEITAQSTEPLTAYAMYTYRVRKVNVFGDRSQFSIPDSTRCNRPPKIIAHDVPIIDGSGFVFQIRWERARPNAVPAGFRTRIWVYLDSLDDQIAEEFVVDDDTVFTLRRAAPDHNYIFRIQEIPNDAAFPATPWSRPYTVSNLLALTPFHIQQQPRGHIYVNWRNPELIRTYRISAFQVCRDEFCFRVPNTVTSWMDSVQSLTPGQAYRYRVFGIDSLDQVVAANAGTDTCDTGSVFIPDVLPYADKYFNDDSITVSWTWRDRQGRLDPSTRGATRCWIEASLSRSFPGHPDETVETGPFPADPEIRAKRVAIPALGNRENEKVYFRIRAEDAWENPANPLWSTDFHPVKIAIYDDVPPRPVTDLAVVSTEALYLKSDTVISEIRWSGNGVETPNSSSLGVWNDLVANVADYQLFLDGSLLWETPARPATGVYTFLDTLQNRSQAWHVVVFDSAGNVTVSPIARNAGYLPTPASPTPTRLRACDLTPVATDSSGIQYFIEMAMNPGHFRLGYEVGGGDQIDRFLCQSGWIDDLSYACSSGWGAIVLDSTWFRVKARRWWRSQFWESGWSDISAFGVNGDPDSPKEIQSVPELPKEFVVHPNYPNPFNAATVIAYDLPEAGRVRILLFNITGELVCSLAEGPQAAGFHTVSWDGRDSVGRPTASGIYLVFATIESGEKVFQKRFKMMMVK